MPQRILGLDLGATAVRAIVLESSYRTFAVAAAAAVPVAPASEGGPSLRDRQLEAARTLLAAPELAYDTALVAVPGASALHVVTLPFTDPRRIEASVGFEVEGQIPFDLAEVASDWQLLRTADGTTEPPAPVVRTEQL